MVIMPHLVVLTRLELRRAGATLLRLVGASLLVVGACILSGRSDPATLGPVALGFAFGYAFVPPILIFRDRIEGTLECLQRLPTTGETVAAAKLCAAAIIVLPGAIHVAVTLAVLAGRMELPIGSPVSVVVTLMLVWLLLSVFAQIGVALLGRFDPERMSILPALVVAASLLLLPPLLERLLPNPMQTIVSLAAKPWAPVLGFLGGLGLLGLGIALAFVVLRRVIVDYDPAMAAVKAP